MYERIGELCRRRFHRCVLCARSRRYPKREKQQNHSWRYTSTGGPRQMTARSCMFRSEVARWYHAWEAQRAAWILLGAENARTVIVEAVQSWEDFCDPCFLHSTIDSSLSAR